jgi:hypothetical protein
MIDTNITVILSRESITDRDGEEVIPRDYYISPYSKDTESIDDIITECSNYIHNNTEIDHTSKYKTKFFSQFGHSYSVEILFDGLYSKSDSEYAIEERIKFGLDANYIAFYNKTKKEQLEALALKESNKQKEISNKEYDLYLSLKNKYENILTQ